MIIKIKKQLKSDNKVSNEQNFSVKESYLHFASMKALVNSLNEISDQSDLERAVWEESIGFKSQRSIINEIIEQEDIYDKICESKYEGVDIKDLDESNFHSDIYNNYLKKGVIKIMNEGTENEYWDYAVFNRGFVDFINEDGMYAVGDTLYQVTDKYIKALKDSDFSKIELLKNATENDESNHIYIIHNESSLKGYNPKDRGFIENNWESSSG
ncbi:MAG: hypothetical protein JEZ09_17285 [Salinivirgaceae bacterium]|nr:hypothetical protein [Salinivirgaceae bacterium]